jgi:hypothetical protein
VGGCRWLDRPMLCLLRCELASQLAWRNLKHADDDRTAVDFSSSSGLGRGVRFAPSRCNDGAKQGVTSVRFPVAAPVHQITDTLLLVLKASCPSEIRADLASQDLQAVNCHVLHQYFFYKRSIPLGRDMVINYPSQKENISEPFSSRHPLHISSPW